MRALICLTVALSIASCKARRDGAALKSEGDGAATTAASEAPMPGLDPSAPTSTLTVGAVALTAGEVGAIATELDQTITQGMQAAGVLSAEGLGLGLEKQQSATDVKKSIDELRSQLADARVQLERLKELGDDSSTRMELEKTVNRLIQQLDGNGGELQQAEQKQVEDQKQQQQQQQKQQQDQAQQKQQKAEEEARAKQKAQDDELARQQQLAKDATEKADKEQKAKKKREKWKSDKIAEIQRLIRDIAKSQTTRSGAGCTVKAFSTASALDLNQFGSWPFSSATIDDLSDRQIWSGAADHYLAAGTDYSVSGGIATYILMRYPDDCGSTFRPSANCEYMGEVKKGSNTFLICGVVSGAGRFNSAVLLTNGVSFYRQKTEVTDLSIGRTPDPANVSKIFGNDFMTCSGIAVKNKYMCASSAYDCKGIVEDNKYMCESNDCKAIVGKNYYLCDTFDCKAIVSGNATQCDSKDCIAAVTKNGQLCDHDGHRKPN